MKQGWVYFLGIFVAFWMLSNEGCKAEFDEVLCGQTSYDAFVKDNPSYNPIQDSTVWISKKAREKSKVTRKYTTLSGTSLSMNYPLRSVSMAELDGDLFYFFTYLPTGSVYSYESLEPMVVEVFNCMGRSVKVVNYGETPAGIYADIMEELYDKADDYYFYSGYYLIEMWRVN